MEILSHKHKQIIIDLNKITDNKISVGGSIEDYLLLGKADKPIGDIDFIIDDSPLKQGLFSPGMHIPIVSVDQFRKDNADIAYLFAWNHKTEIFAKEEKFIKKNTKWISHVKI